MAKKEKVKNEVKDSKSKTKTVEPSETADPKKPTRGLAIGENFGWTGKLPVTLLNEHCQKQKWNKCDYSMMKRAGGLLCVITLSWENPKTKEVINVKFVPSYKPRPTTNEARHMAATFVLHRINFIKNMKMLLPVIFRDYWTELESERLVSLKENKKLHDIKYNVNPFLVHLEQQESKRKQEKEREDRINQESKIQRKAVSLGQRNAVAEKKTLSSLHSIPKKVWESAPLLDIPAEIRADIELSVREYLTWDKKTDDVAPNVEEIKKLVALGFRESHAQEAFQYTWTFTGALEWLIFHLPEDDLPSSFSKSEKESEVSLRVAKPLKTELAMKRLRHSGFSNDVILKIYEDNDEDYFQTSIELTKLLGSGGEASPVEDSQELWDQELEAISMSKTDVTIEDTNVVTIGLDVDGIAENKVSVRLFKSQNYPNEVPGIQLVVSENYKIANYVKLSILKSLISELTVSECMIYSIIEWLELHMMSKIEDPGSLCMYEQNEEQISRNFSQVEQSRKQRQQNVELIKKSYVDRSDALKKLQKQREALPAWKKQESIVSLIAASQITLITGETGSGKSTQVVQFILDHLNKEGDFSTTILCTQPRRISAMGLASRISETRGDKVGQETGYMIRGESKVNSQTRITFLTTGILLRMLQQSFKNKDDSDKIFAKVGYIFIDEVHERSVDSDFLLIILRDVLKKFKKLKIVLMSATIEREKFDKFFGTTINNAHIEGRTFPIEDFYLDDILQSLDYKMEVGGELIKPRSDSAFFKKGTINYDLLVKLVTKADRDLTLSENNGSILVFLPGVGEINRAMREVSAVLPNAIVLPLHSSLSPRDQNSVFKSYPGKKRKIVLATNIAETSITISDCVVVIDTGRSKTMFFDADLNTTKLVEEWCSQAEIKQRRGRSGRVTSGTCYHLYTKETAQSMLKQPIPEIKRVRLENLYLIVKSMGVENVENFLASGLDSPDASAMVSAKKLLEDVGALSEDRLTNLGRYLSFLPMDPHTGKLLILGCIFGCLDFCVTLAAINAVGSIFANTMENRSQIKSVLTKYSEASGDLVGEANVFLAYRNNPSKSFMREHCLSFTAVNDVQSTIIQFHQLLDEMGFVGNKEPKPKLNQTLVRAIVTGSFYPNIVRVQYPNQKYFKSASGSIAVDPDAKEIKLWIKNENESQEQHNFPSTRVFLHPSSSLFLSKTAYEDDGGEANGGNSAMAYTELTPYVPKSESAFKSAFLTYKSSHMTSKLYIRGVTPADSVATLLFGGNFEYDAGGVVLDGWIPIRTWCKNGVLIKQVRKLLDKYIDEKLSSVESTTHGTILNVIEKVINI
ncbi:uncharacterized protein LODBEIA_P31960 [Lodderomyces beijingensis]|uniref:RNA helicase n=1 Tax=Lodderomyces beijingensis TaxID=1775926 RepID=A0ABP0ZRT4_9ASCO